MGKAEQQGERREKRLLNSTKPQNSHLSPIFPPFSAGMSVVCSSAVLMPPLLYFGKSCRYSNGIFQEENIPSQVPSVELLVRGPRRIERQRRKAKHFPLSLVGEQERTFYPFCLVLNQSYMFMSSEKSFCNLCSSLARWFQFTASEFSCIKTSSHWKSCLLTASEQISVLQRWVSKFLSFKINLCVKRALNVD